MKEYAKELAELLRVNGVACRTLGWSVLCEGLTDDLEATAQMVADLLNENGWEAANIGCGRGYITILAPKPCRPGDANIPFIGKSKRA